MARLLRLGNVYQGYVSLSPREITTARSMGYSIVEHDKKMCVSIADAAAARAFVTAINQTHSSSKKAQREFGRSPRGAFKTPKK